MIDISQILALSTIITQIAILFLLLLILFRKKPSVKKILKIISKESYKLILAISLIATLGSLYYSEIKGFKPCTLCWYQRIFMYPLTIISLISTIINDKKTQYHILTLSIIGAMIAGYHYIAQITTLTVCSAQEVNCAITYSTYFGYVTIPLMALTAFLLIIILSTINLIEKVRGHFPSLKG
ncbi:MAG: disulfide bond formation protein B [Candidatus Woesearchaeota archaeon]